MVNISKNEEQLTAEIMGKINLSKDKSNLEQKVINLSKCVVNLSKKNKVDIGSTEAQVVFVIDNSGSMDGVFYDGTLQKVITTLLPLGLTFDDNGKAEVYQFNHKCKKITDLSLDNYENYVKKHMEEPNGTTKYSGPMKDILCDYFGIDFNGSKVTYNKPKKKGFFAKLFGGGNQTKEDTMQTSTGVMADTSEYPVFILYITDGDIDYDDKSMMNELVRQSSKVNCFIQFIGASKVSTFEYLKSLDDLDGRDCDNTGFVKFDSLSGISDEDLYNAVLEQYAKWLHVKGF